MSALFSEGGERHATYRWSLRREVQERGLVAVLCGVNPSTAGAEVNDQTILKDIGFAERLGWRRVIKVNKFAYRSPDVRSLARAEDPIGPENDLHLREAFDEADLIVPCWGPLSKLPVRLRDRYVHVHRLMQHSGKPIRCLGTAKDGQPRHTLMLPYSTPLEPWYDPLFQ